MKTDRLEELLANCIDRIYEFEEGMAGEVLLSSLDFTYEELAELGYAPQLYTIDELDGYNLEVALNDTKEAEFGSEEVSREVLIDYNRMTDARYTYTGYFVGYGSTLDQNTPILREDD
jgi:hypothetical protein